ncbi:MAG TPA: thioredoxin [Actinomycetaceae bacterium]|nr:thioredoxin [Actinomycetaceae bacterium]
MSSAPAVTEESFDAEVLQSPIPVLVDFWAEWCAPCRALSPILERIAEERDGKLKIVKLNIDENPFLAERYQISSIPALTVFVDGEPATTIIGARPKPILEAELAEYLR